MALELTRHQSIVLLIISLNNERFETLLWRSMIMILTYPSWLKSAFVIYPKTYWDIGSIARLEPRCIDAKDNKNCRQISRWKWTHYSPCRLHSRYQQEARIQNLAKLLENDTAGSGFPHRSVCTGTCRYILFHCMLDQMLSFHFFNWQDWNADLSYTENIRPYTHHPAGAAQVCDFHWNVLWVCVKSRKDKG